MRISSASLALVALAVACSRSGTQKDSAAPRYGAVMAEIGQRFELSGRAFDAGRFELAAFEVGELSELFNQDLPRAEPPKEGPRENLKSMADAFAKVSPARLKSAIGSRDPLAFRAAYKEAAVSCNSCHAASGHGFIEVPSEPNKPVPNLDPAAADAGK